MKIASILIKEENKVTLGKNIVEISNVKTINKLIITLSDIITNHEYNKLYELYRTSTIINIEFIDGKNSIELSYKIDDRSKGYLIIKNNNKVVQSDVILFTEFELLLKDISMNRYTALKCFSTKKLIKRCKLLKKIKYFIFMLSFVSIVCFAFTDFLYYSDHFNEFKLLYLSMFFIVFFLLFYVDGNEFKFNIKLYLKNAIFSLFLSLSLVQGLIMPMHFFSGEEGLLEMVIVNKVNDAYIINDCDFGINTREVFSPICIKSKVYWLFSNEKRKINVSGFVSNIAIEIQTIEYK
ncbi:hypothetical protein GNP80_19645 [Aliivibrio fischeri]|uniref:hypothetical protein n=1 Tax=Aliivibrio fischeri TaxID=668 RepID=UPI0012DA8277|nr:hypothetical protein [Aliivibrio fischeri]MUK94633.1 hypothetical protein [Aliivibrio fischeri]